MQDWQNDITTKGIVNIMREETAGHVVLAVLCTVLKSADPYQVRLPTLGFASSGEPLDKHSYTELKLHSFQQLHPSIWSHNDFQHFWFTASICIQLSKSCPYISSVSTHSRCLSNGFYYAVYNTLFLHRMKYMCVVLIPSHVQWTSVHIHQT